jgi:hypothetical protein
MTSNLKGILSAVGVAALLASPAVAKSHVRTHHVAPATVPADAQAYAPAYVAHPLVTPYAPNVQQPAHETPGPNPDFQLGSEK